MSNLIELNRFSIHFWLWNKCWYVAYDNIKDVTLCESRRTTLNRFRHLKELNVRCSISQKLFFAEIDLSRIEHLTLSSLDHIQSFILYLYAMPCLTKWSVYGHLTTDFVNDLKDYRKIVTSTDDISYIIEGLICLFPRVERHDISTIRLRKDMIRWI